MGLQLVGQHLTDIFLMNKVSKHDMPGKQLVTAGQRPGRLSKGFLYHEKNISLQQFSGKRL